MKLNFKLLCEAIREVINEARPKFKPHEKVKNRGNVAEGLLGAAITAQFLNGGESDITAPAVEKVLSHVASASEPLQDYETGDVPEEPYRDPVHPGKAAIWNLKRPNGTIDTVQLKIQLKAIDLEDLFNAVKRVSIDELYESVVAYANSKDVKTKARELALDDKSSRILISSEGTKDEKGTKIDLRVVVDGKEIEFGKISVKATHAKQLGQVGLKWRQTTEKDKKKIRGIYDIFEKLFGVELSPRLEKPYLAALATKPRDKQTLIKVISKIYKDAYNKLNTKYDRDNEDEFTEFLKQIARGIRYEATLGEEGVKLVHLDKRSFELLDFDDIEDKFAGLVDLDVELLLPKGPGDVPFLTVIAGGNKMLTIRPKIQSDGQLFHYVQNEQGLNDLLRREEEIENEKEFDISEES